MATVLVRHKVNDYAKWKAVLDETKPMAKKFGVRSQRVLRNFANPNEVVVVNEFDDMNTAQKFAQSDELKKIMERAGVAETPSVWFLNETDKFTL
jgi:antibiotic biosynthesis monooxygenase (ABM) superfamily enzyme